MDAASLLAFDEQAQASFEACYPASLKFPDIAGPVACAGGATRQLGIAFVAGGSVSDFDLSFRVRKERLGNTPPAAGINVGFDSKLWRIERVANPPTSVAYVIHCVNPNK